MHIEAPYAHFHKHRNMDITSSPAEEASLTPRSAEIMSSDVGGITLPLQPTPSRKRRADGSDEVTPSKSSRRSGQGAFNTYRTRLKNAIQKAIDVKKGIVLPCTHVKLKMPLDACRALLIPHASSVTPASFDSSSAVIFASLKGADAVQRACGEIKSPGKWHVQDMEVILVPATTEMSVWWTMSDAKE